MRLLKRSRNRRGATLIEAMIAMGIFATGILTVFQGVIVASRQNSIANKVTTAGAIAQQVRSGLTSQGRARLVAPGGALANCTNDATVRALADGLETLPGACVIDLDAYDLNVAPPSQVVPAYPAAHANGYRRVLVRFTSAEREVIGVVISFSAAGRRQFQKQFHTFFNGTAIGSGVEF